MLKKIYYFYKDGFSNMKLGKSLWLLVLIKLFIIFTLIKLFFPNILKEHFQNNKQRSDFILNQLTQGE